jgi:DNA polymerase III subunit psi
MTSSLHNQYLQEMGIERWELKHPERLSGHSQPTYNLPPECRLLLVSPLTPTPEEARLFEKVLKSFHVDLQEAQHCTPTHLSQLNSHRLEWIWFAGCSPTSGIAAKVLTSVPLSQIDGNQPQRRALWQQICSYQVK